MQSHRRDSPTPRQPILIGMIWTTIGAMTLAWSVVTPPMAPLGLAVFVFCLFRGNAVMRHFGGSLPTNCIAASNYSMVAAYVFFHADGSLMRYFVVIGYLGAALLALRWAIRARAA